MLIFLDCSIFVFSLIFDRGKKRLLCEFIEIHRCHATHCMIKIINTTNNEMFKEFVSLEFNK